MSKSKSPQKRKECAVCKKTQALSNFYNANSPFFPDKKIHVCKECSLKIAEESFEGLQALMKLINKPILEDLFKEDVGDYIRQMNSLPQYRLSIYEDSTQFEKSKSLSNIKRVKPTEISEDELRESEDYFGIGYEEQDYIFLNHEMNNWRSQYDISSKALEDLIREICLTTLDIRKRRSKGQDVDKQLKTLQDLLGSSNLKPMQESGALASEQTSFGLLLKKYEEERPLPEPDPRWADVDGIGKYIRTFFLGHMARLLGKENKFLDEYNKEMDKYTVNPHKEDE